MKVLIVSDNHGNEASLEDLVHIHGDDMDAWLHCGDSEFGSQHSIWKTFQTVKGNMDWEKSFPEVHIEKQEETVFGLLHGHRHQVKRTLEPMKEVALANEASIIFYGHTHVAKVEKLDDIYFINPGSIAQPRGPLRIGSYAIYEVDDTGNWIHFYDWNHQELKDLSQKLD